MPRIDRAPPKIVRAHAPTVAKTAKKASSSSTIAPLAAPTLTPKPLARSSDVALWSTRAEQLEAAAIEAVEVDEKRALTKNALVAWVSAAAADISILGAHTHGPQRNAF